MDELTLLKNRCESAFGMYQQMAVAVQNYLLAMPKCLTEQLLDELVSKQLSAKKASEEYEAAKGDYLAALFRRRMCGSRSVEAAWR